MSTPEAKPHRISWLVWAGVILYTISAIRFVVLFILNPSRFTAFQAVGACALGAGVWWIVRKARKRALDMTPNRDLPNLASRKIRQLVICVVLVDSLIVGTASWLFVRGPSHVLPTLLVASVWIGTPLVFWRACRRIRDGDLESE